MHRDIKPNNILVDTKCHSVKLADFGCAMSITTSPLTERPVGHTAMCYRAPELLRDSTVVSFECDAWALGCVFGEMLSARALFDEGSEEEVLQQILQVREFR